ncbi:MAG: ABC transporter ATP-binding protein [Chitinophagales bacterium]
MDRRATGLRLLSYIRPYLRPFLTALFAMVVLAAINLSVPYLFGQTLIDRILLQTRSRTYLTLLAVGIVFLYVVRGLFMYGYTYLTSFVGFRVVTDLRRALFVKMQDLSLAFHERHRTGELIARVTNDTMLVHQAVAMGLGDLLLQGLQLSGTLVAVFLLHWRLALTAIVVFPLMALVINRFGRVIRRASRNMQERVAELTTVLQEALAGIRIVKAFTMEEHQADRFTRQNEASFGASLKSAQVGATLSPTVDFLFVTAVALVLWFGGSEVLAGRLTTGKLIAFFGYLALAANPLAALSRVYQALQQALAAGERIFSILDAEPEVGEKPGAKPLPPLAGRVVFEQVSFAYGDGPPVLSGIDLTVEPGKVVALVGPSGAGKTTLVNLLPRFYDPTGGRILVDGHDLREVTLESLRRQVGVVPQETMLFGVTVRENIAFGRPGASEEEIVAAAKAANAHDFILGLPQGYDTVLGERGESLSGGQRQRIAIARALLRDPRLLILDEATSALDTEAERVVQEALERLMRGRTTFVIAHRLSTVQFADQIVVLSGGKIVEAGTHQALLERGGLYRRLYDQQFRGEEPSA